MPQFENMDDKTKIKLAAGAVQYRIPIAPQIETWLHETGLYKSVIVPMKRKERKANE